MKRITTLFVILAAGGCSQTPSPESGELRVTPLAGDVRILQDGESSRLEEAMTVDSGVSLLTGTDGRAQVELPSGSSVEMAPQAHIRMNGDEPHIATGSALVRAVSDITVHAGEGGDAEIRATDSVFRVDSDISLTLAVYEGAARVLGSLVPEIGALQQATVIQGTDIYRTRPLEVRRNDPWDAELLGEAIDLGLRLVGLERGLNRQLPSGQEIEAVSQTLAEDFPAGAIHSALTALDHDAARTVVAAALAREIERLDGGSRAEIFAEVVTLLNLEAHWIVVVAKWGLATAAAQVLAALGDFAVTFAELFTPSLGTPSPSSGQDAAAQLEAPIDDGSDGDPQDDPGGEPPDDSKGPPGGGGGPPPPPPDEPPDDEPPMQSCDNVVECAVDEIIPGGRDLPDIGSRHS